MTREQLIRLALSTIEHEGHLSADQMRAIVDGIQLVGIDHLPERSRSLMFHFRAAHRRSVSRVRSLAVAGFVASIVCAVVAATTPLLIACTAIAAIAALAGLKKDASPAEGCLFTALMNIERPAKRDVLQSEFARLCEDAGSVQASDFAVALNGLLGLGCIQETGNGFDIHDITFQLGQSA